MPTGGAVRLPRGTSRCDIATLYHMAGSCERRACTTFLCFAGLALRCAPGLSLRASSRIRYATQVAARHLGRLAGWLLACALVPVGCGVAFGRSWAAIGFAIAAFATLWLLLWLPRAAHAAFDGARHARAARRYRLIASLAFTPARERAAVLSRAGCDVAGGRFAAAGRILDRFEATALDSAERVTWLNNRACIALDAGGDATHALALVEQAVALRPDVPAVQHTRAAALIALGRFDEAIGILEAMRTGGELAPALEAVRCRELAKAWEHKGEPDYAADYRDRSRLVAL
jgi:tetratricopeptide (TPR) repeat protein